MPTPPAPTHPPVLQPADSLSRTLPADGATGRVTWLLAGTLAIVAWAGLWNKLRVEWTINDQYNYGWFVPFFAAFFFVSRWPDRPEPTLVSRSARWLVAALAVAGLLLLWPIRLMEEPNPDWRLLYWGHALCITLVTACSILWIGGRSYLKHFAFPLGFLLLAVPWPSEFEQSVVQSLMRAVAEIASLGMNVIGVPAEPQGNLIHIRDQTVGVDEACSGIRSLQTTLMIALFLGELSRLSWQRRLVLLVGGWVVAMTANVFRSSLLVWIAASRGTEALERFHDAAGISILIIVFAGLLWICHALGRGRPSPPPGLGDRRQQTSAGFYLRPVPRGFAVAVGCWLIATEAGTFAWYNFRVPAPPSASRWTVDPPQDAHGYQNLRVDDRSARLLRYDKGLSARWDRPGVPAVDCSLYFFRWEPGHASSVQADQHQPHICLTASGLTQVADWGIQPLDLPGGIVLPVRRYQFEWHRHPIFVFFVVWQDGNTPYAATGAVGGSRWDRLRPVLKRRPLLGRQTLEFIVAGLKDPQAADERFRQEIAAIVHPLDGKVAVATPGESALPHPELSATQR